MQDTNHHLEFQTMQDYFTNSSEDIGPFPSIKLFGKSELDQLSWLLRLTHSYYYIFVDKFRFITATHWILRSTISSKSEFIISFEKINKNRCKDRMNTVHEIYLTSEYGICRFIKE